MHAVVNAADEIIKELTSDFHATKEANGALAGPTGTVHLDIFGTAMLSGMVGAEPMDEVEVTNKHIVESKE